MSEQNKRVVVVTGGAGGVGSVIVRGLAAAGMAVVVNDYGTALDGSDPNPEPAERLAAEITAQGGEATAHTGDVSDLDVARGLVALAVDTYGHLDAMVTSHGIFRQSSVFDMTLEDWNALVHNHLTGTFTCLQAALLQLREQGHGGSVVCVGSTSAYDGNPNIPHYAAAKGGVHALAKGAAMSAGEYNINVNVIIPNALTRVTMQPFAKAQEFWQGPEPTADLGAALTLALLDPACRHITGQVFTVSGERLGRYVHPMPERSEVRPVWTAPDVIASLNGFMECPPLRRFAIYGLTMPGSDR